MKSKILLFLASVSLLATSVFAAAAVRGIPRTVPLWSDLANENINLWSSMVVLEDGGVAVATQTASLPSWAVSSDYDKLARTDASGDGKWVRSQFEHVDVRWTGAIPDDSIGDSAALISAAAIAESAGVPMFIPEGTFDFTSYSSKITPTARLVVVGVPGRSILRQTDQGELSTIFDMTTATNLVLKDIILERARYGIYIPDNYGQGLSVRMEGGGLRSVRFGIYGSHVLDGAEVFADLILMDGVVADNPTDDAYAYYGIFLDKVVAHNVTLRNSRFTGGQHGISVVLDDPALYNPLTNNARVFVENNWFEGMGHATNSCQAVNVLHYMPQITGNTFRLGSRISSAAAEQNAIYVYGASGLIEGNLFDRWGNSTNKQDTIVCKGPTAQVDQWAVAAGNNHPPGWGLAITRNRFIDNPSDYTYTGHIGLDTSSAEISGNEWDSCTGTYLVHLAPSSSNSNKGYVWFLDNRIIRCSADEVFKLTSNGVSVRDIRLDGNEIIDSRITTVHYLFYGGTQIDGISLSRNYIENCGAFVMCRLTESGSFSNIRIESNHIQGSSTNTTSSLMYTAYAGNAFRTTFKNNFGIHCTTPFNANTGTFTYDGLEMSGNTFTNVVNNLEFRTINGTKHSVWGNVINGATDYSGPLFRGVTTTTPTKFLYPGSSFMSNSVFYIYDGSSWVAP